MTSAEIILGKPMVGSPVEVAFSSITWSKPTAFQAVRFSAVLD
jgi:hypothetical protein